MHVFILIPYPYSGLSQRVAPSIRDRVMLVLPVSLLHKKSRHVYLRTEKVRMLIRYNMKKNEVMSDDDESKREYYGMYMFVIN
jgi:hypothetical protein